MDKYLDFTACVHRLCDDYRRHGNLIVAVDFDNTIYDFHNEGLQFPQIIKVLKQCNALGFPVVVFTANEDKYLVTTHCTGLGIEIYGVNVNVIPTFTTGKIYYNILLDDRAGLSSAFNILKETLANIKKETK